MSHKARYEVRVIFGSGAMDFSSTSEACTETPVARYATNLVFAAVTYNITGDQLFLRDLEGFAHVFRLSKHDTVYARSLKPATD